MGYAILFASFSALLTWLLERALRTGHVFYEQSYGRGSEPLLYWMTLCLFCFMALIFALAAMSAFRQSA